MAMRRGQGAFPFLLGGAFIEAKRPQRLSLAKRPFPYLFRRAIH